MRKHENNLRPTPIKVGNATVGVHVPIIEKDIYFNEFGANELTWKEAVASAESIGRRLPTLQEAHILLYLWEELRPFAPDLFAGQFWAGTELKESACNAWFFSEDGCVNCISKQVTFQVLALADPE